MPPFFQPGSRHFCQASLDVLLFDPESSQVRSGAVRVIAAVTSPTPAGEGEPVFEYTDEHGRRHALF